MATVTMPPKKEADDETSSQGQSRPQFRRYRLQVDRQMKNSFDDKAAAEKSAANSRRFPLYEFRPYQGPLAPFDPGTSTFADVPRHQ